MFHFRSERTAGSFPQKLLSNSQKATLAQCPCCSFPTKKPEPFVIGVAVLATQPGGTTHFSNFRAQLNADVSGALAAANKLSNHATAAFPEV